MEIQQTEIPGVKLILPRKFGDDRGFFSETYNKQAFTAAGIAADFVQDNFSLSGPAGTVRGLHFQIHPFAQAKLVRVSRGSVFDVVVDLRRGSPTYGRHLGVTLSAAAWNQLYIPVGLAHGFCTLEPDTEFVYKVTTYYAPAHDRGIQWDDPELGIAWPVGPGEAVLSEKDRRLPRFAELADHFTYASGSG